MSSVLFDHPGPKARARHKVIAAASAVVTVGALWWALAQFKEKGNLDAAKWTPFLTADLWVNYLIPGLLNTLAAAAASIVLAGAFGLAFGMGRLSHVPAVRWVSTVIVEFFRSVPVLVMMFFAFYVSLSTTCSAVTSTRSRPWSPDLRSTTGRSSPSCCVPALEVSPEGRPRRDCRSGSPAGRPCDPSCSRKR